jgi:hypothetical protein
MRVLLLTLLLIPGRVLACPTCSDIVTEGPSNGLPKTFLILCIFIGLIYIPLFMLFRAAKTYDPKNGDGHN